MKYKLRSYLFAAAGFMVMNMVAAGPSYAATLIGTTNDALGIDGLTVDSITYDVTFVHLSYNQAYAVIPPTFIGNSSGAADAATALSSALTNFGVTHLVGSASPFGWEAALVPDSAQPVIHGPAAFCGSGGPNSSCSFTAVWVVVGVTLCSDCGDFVIDNNYAIFAPGQDVIVGSTPLPAALSLFAGGLGVVGLFARRRKRKAAAALAAA
jgi:hypothetical protein